MSLKCVANEESNMEPIFGFISRPFYIYTIYTIPPKDFPTFFSKVMLYPKGPQGAYLGAKLGSILVRFGRHIVLKKYLFSRSEGSLFGCQVGFHVGLFRGERGLDSASAHFMVRL